MRWIVGLIIMCGFSITAIADDDWSIGDQDLAERVRSSNPAYVPWPSPPSDLADWTRRSQYNGYGDYLQQHQENQHDQDSGSSGSNPAWDLLFR